jgi:hypothetical protein
LYDTSREIQTKPDARNLAFDRAASPPIAFEEGCQFVGSSPIPLSATLT